MATEHNPLVPSARSERLLEVHPTAFFGGKANGQMLELQQGSPLNASIVHLDRAQCAALRTLLDDFLRTTAGQPPSAGKLDPMFEE